MLPKGDHFRSKRNTKIHKSSAVQHPSPINAAKFSAIASTQRQKETLRVGMLSRPEDSDTVDMDMDPKTDKEQTTDKNLDEVNTGTTAVDSNVNATTDHGVDSMVCAEEGFTIGNDSLLPVEQIYNRYTVANDDKNPVQEYQERPITANHDMDLAEEPLRLSSSVDHEKNLAKGTNGIPNNVDFRTNPVETPDNNKAKIKPSNLLDYPDDILRQILRYVLVRDSHIRPYWNFGATEVTAEESCKENVNPILVAFAGNKKLIDEATTIFYGENAFKLRHAKVSLWWLKRIGPNISKIKRLVLSVEEGVMDQFGTRFETLWYSILLLLEAQHKLECLKVNFANWTCKVDGRDGLDPKEDIYIWEPRHGVIRTLLGFRGLDMATVTPGKYLSDYSAELIEDALVLSPGQTNNELLALEDFVRERKRTKALF